MAIQPLPRAKHLWTVRMKLQTLYRVGIKPRTFLLPARSVGSFQFVCVSKCESVQNLHVKRRHGRRLIDVASLCVSVIDGHRRMEGREELRCSCATTRKEKKKNMNIFSIMYFFPKFQPTTNEELWFTAIPAQIRPHQGCS